MTGSEMIHNQISVKYRRLRLNFTSQIESSSAKVSSYLSGIVINIAGPTESRKGLFIFNQPIDPEMWDDAYRTASKQAIFVIGGSIPITVLVEEQKKLQNLKNLVALLRTKTNEIQTQTQTNNNNDINGRNGGGNGDDSTTDDNNNDNINKYKYTISNLKLIKLQSRRSLNPYKPIFSPQKNILFYNIIVRSLN